MKIAYNPITAEALTTAPANNDITFDLRGLNIFVRGVKLKGTDTTYSVFKKHTSSSGGGYNGLVPVPSYTSTNVRFLREDGTWQIMPDTKVTQSETTTANFRPVILGYQNSTDVSTLNQKVTNQVYTTTSVYVQPSTGFLYANKLFSGGKEVATKDSLDLSRYVTIDTTQNITSTKIWPSASSDLYIGYSSSNIATIKHIIHTTAGWARGYGFVNEDNEIYCTFSAYGVGDTLLYQYVGNDYQNPWQKWNSTRSDLSIPLFINNNKVWHAGNDGEGSGMDADLIDGTHKKDLFTLLTSSASTNLSVTIGGTTKAITDLYATTAEKLSTASAGTPVRPVYFNNGIPVACNYQFGNAEGNASLNNGTLNTNLNSDMLEGFHGSVTAVANTFALRDSKSAIATTGINYSLLGSVPKSQGWYRIFQFGSTNVEGASAIIHIDRLYYSPSNESYVFAINLTYGGGISITQLSGYANVRLITKIRVNYTNNNKAYVDLYYNTSSYFKNTVKVYGSGRGSFQAPTLVTDTTGTNYEFETVNGFKCSLGIDNINTDLIYRSKKLSAQSLDANKLLELYTQYQATSDMNNWSSSYTFTNFPTSRPAGSFSLLNIGEGNYIRQIYGAYNDNHLYVRSNYYSGTQTSWKSWNKIAFITDNVASATKLQTARTINGTLFDGTENIVTSFWGISRTITLAGAVTGSVSINGSQNVTINTTFQTTSIDGKYVGGNKQANHGSAGTSYTADTYSSNFVNKSYAAFAERGSWTYANNGYVTTDLGRNIPLAGTAIFQWGASDTNKTQLFITPGNTSNVSSPFLNEMLFYTSNGSGYNSAWTRVVTNRNYTSIIKKLGSSTVGGPTKPIYLNEGTPTAFSQTVGSTALPVYLNAGTISPCVGSSIFSNLSNSGNNISITVAGQNRVLTPAYATVSGSTRKLYKIGSSTNSQTWTTSSDLVGNGITSYTDTSTSGRWDNYGSIFQFSNVDNPDPGTRNHWVTQIWSATSSKLGVRWRTNTGAWTAMQTILTNSNYTNYINVGNYVTSLGTNGNYLTWTKNGTTNNITVPFATKSTWTTYMYYGAISNLNSPSTISTGGYRLVYDSYPNTATNQPVFQDNANSLLTLFKSKHGTSSQYLSQLAFPNNGRFYYRYSTSGSFSAWKTIAFTTDVKDPTDYYWANIAVSTTSSTTTSPTFNAATVTKLNVKGQANSNAYITADTAYNMYFVANGISLLSLDGSGKAVRSGSGYASQISLGTSSVRWSNLYSVAGNFSGDVTANRIKITDTDAVRHIEFSRTSYNYLTAPAGTDSSINFIVNGQDLLIVNADLSVRNGLVCAGTNNATSLGNSTYRWSGLYSVLGNFSSNVTANGFIKSGSSDSYVLLGGGGHKLLSSISGDGKYVLKTGDTMTGNLKITGGTDTRNMELSYGSLKFNVPTGGWAAGFSYYSTSGSSLGQACGAYGGGNSISYYYYGGSYDSPKMVISPAGNVGIGVKSPSYSLHASGSVYSSKGFIKSGSSDSYVLLGGGGHKALTDFGYNVKYYAKYSVTFNSSLVRYSFSRTTGNYNFISSITRNNLRNISIVLSYPSGYTFNNTIINIIGRHQPLSSMDPTNTSLGIKFNTDTSFYINFLCF